MIDNCKPSVAKTMRHELVHLAASVVLAALFFIYYDNILLAGFTFSVCMFLDGDHLFDYFGYLIKFKRPFNLKEFLSGIYFADWQKFLTPLHSWEAVIVFFLMFFVASNPWFLAISLALAVHYLVDYFTNDVNKKAYFILYRMSHSFKKVAIRKDFNE